MYLKLTLPLARITSSQMGVTQLVDSLCHSSVVCCRDALLHVCRIHRILSQPRGNALLVGVGGSGRKSLARLAAYIGELKVFSIEITNTYRLAEFREDLKGLYRQAGVAGKPTMFLFDEAQVRPGRQCRAQ